VKAEQRNIIKLLSFVSFLLLLVFISQELNLRYERNQVTAENWDVLNDSNRIVASSSEDKGLLWERELAKKLGMTHSEREAASVGSPRALSGFTFGELSENYRIVTQPDLKGRVFIKELEYIEGVESSTKPLYVTNSYEFLSKNSYLFGLDEKFLKPDSSDMNQERYQSKTLDGKDVGVRLAKDPAGRLIRLSVQVE